MTRNQRLMLVMGGVVAAGVFISLAVYFLRSRSIDDGIPAAREQLQEETKTTSSVEEVERAAEPAGPYENLIIPAETFADENVLLFEEWRDIYGDQLVPSQDPSVTPAVPISPAEESPPPASPDPDNDGLTTIQEEQIGTDPNNPDTDGDGFNDGDEVQAGYNPLGPGRMQ